MENNFKINVMSNSFSIEFTQSEDFGIEYFEIGGLITKLGIRLSRNGLKKLQQELMPYITITDYDLIHLTGDGAVFISHLRFQIDEIILFFYPREEKCFITVFKNLVDFLKEKKIIGEGK